MTNDSFLQIDYYNKIKHNMLTIVKGDVCKLKLHSTIHCINHNWENGIHLRRHTLCTIYMASMLYVQCLQASLYSDDNEMCIVKTNECDFQAIKGSIICTLLSLHSSNENPSFPWIYVKQQKEQPPSRTITENVTIVGMIDTFDFMMMAIRWVTNHLSP